MAIKLLILTALILLETIVKTDINETEGTQPETEEEYARTRVLSRRKRFIVFPDGSSFQLVFELQNMGFLNIRLVWFGNTAALAWELPTDPSTFYIFKDKEHYKAQRRGDVVKNIYYLDEKGKLIAKVPYKRKMIVNPAFAKRSVAFDDCKKEESIMKLNIKRMHDGQKSRLYLSSVGLTNSSVDFHRNSRKSLYEKLEIYMEALGWRGRECVLRMLCESAQSKSNQGNFIEEIVRAVFTLPRGREFNSLKHQEYDAAHTTEESCFEKYPECQSRVEDMPSQFT